MFVSFNSKQPSHGQQRIISKGQPKAAFLGTKGPERSSLEGIKFLPKFKDDRICKRSSW
jgi:hypothetical protein